MRMSVTFRPRAGSCDVNWEPEAPGMKKLSQDSMISHKA